MGRHPEYPERTLSRSEVEDEGPVLSRPKVVSKGVSKGIFPFSERIEGSDQYSVFNVIARSPEAVEAIS